MYIDNLLQLIRNNDIGCHVGSHVCGAFGYADDVIWLSPSVSGLQTMLDCCREFSANYNVKFNHLEVNLVLFPMLGMYLYVMYI